MREPVSRTLSAFFYRGHSPNNDFFQVRPYFKQIRLGLLPKVDFPEYIEMTEYQNIQTRMLGADSFPYRNVSIDEKIYERAKKALDSMYFVGLQEAYGLSVELLVRDLNVSIPIAVKKERDMGNSKSVKKKKKLILGNTSLMDRVKERNRFDIMLHQRATQRFCTMLKGYPDLYAKLDRTRVSCD
jgi:hypothetical protein